MRADPAAGADGVEVGLVGLRTFRVDRASGALRPIIRHHAMRDPGAWVGGTCIATCGRGHTAPAPGCRCGVYSFPDLQTLRRQYSPAESLVAVIALEGAVIEGTRGWRAQAARVVGLWVDPAVVDTTTATRIAAANPDATFYRDADELVGAFGLRHTPAGTAPAGAELGNAMRAGRDLSNDTSFKRMQRAIETALSWVRRHSLLRSAPRWGRTVARTGRWWALTTVLGYLLGSYDLILGGDRVRTQMGPGPHPGWTAMADASQAITRVAVLLGDAGGVGPLGTFIGLAVFCGVTAAVTQLLGVAFPTSYGEWMVRCTRALVRMMSTVLRLVLACTITAALTGQPSNLTAVGFWALAATWWVVLNLYRVVMAKPVTARVRRFGGGLSLFTLTSAQWMRRHH